MENVAYIYKQFLFRLNFVCSLLCPILVFHTWRRYLKEIKFVQVKQYSKACFDKDLLLCRQAGVPISFSPFRPHDSLRIQLSPIVPS